MYSLQGRRYKKKRCLGEKQGRKILTTVKIFPKLLTLFALDLLKQIIVLHYSPKAEFKYFLTDFYRKMANESYF